ncbi:nucleotidyltransferase domain-containing protein [Candidatus Pacearchaeota archaeon]|nr:nucleotidyltransferase domain-containing protein [Candidatus Pacearchaeota archaeon]
MNIEIKRTVRAGNSSAVILPRAWLNQEVRVELVNKTNDKILHEALTIVSKHMNTKEIIGVYLVGSYARGEESKESDIDILIITHNTDKEMINEGIYNILIVSEKLLNWKLKNDLLPLGMMIREAVPLINSSYLDSIKINTNKVNLKWYVDTTKDKLELIRRALDSTRGKVANSVIYTLILRIRTLYTIRKLIDNEKYSKKEFVKLISKVSGSDSAYGAYVLVKNDLQKDALVTKREAERLYYYLIKQLKEVIELLK